MKQEPFPTKLSKLLTRLRRKAGFSMYELAKRSGVNRSIIMRIEEGTTTNPDTGTLNRVARALQVEPETFYDAVWVEADQPLPSPAVYLRSKYRLSREQIAELDSSIRRAANKPKRTSNERRSP